ncbi:MAG TPA: NAD-dependent epimerase/dehydratase family protein [Candidatus Paceibacterota bacterium]|nr:NAD-dependent epimerase/dehydratase family protein [Candidatus Paceibacterota bacterium]
MAKYIVTGGAGFIGSHVQDLLLEQGHEVHVVDNLLSGKRENLNPGAKFYLVDIRHSGELVSIFRGADGVFHLAAQPRMQYSIQEPALTHGINATGTLNVLLAARDAGVRRVVYSASSSAYGTENHLPFTEDMKARPVIPYAVQKYVGEMYCRTFAEFYGVQTVSLRYFNVYGPRQTTDADGPYATVIGIFLGLAAQGIAMPVVGDGQQRRDFTHVRDVARANLLAMRAKSVGRGEVINIGTGRNHSVLDVAKLIGGEREHVSARPGEARATLADNTLAGSLLGWEPEVPFEYGMAELKRLHGIR